MRTEVVDSCRQPPHHDQCLWPLAQVQRPLRSRATSLMPFFSPKILTTSSLAGTVILRRGDRQIPVEHPGLVLRLAVRTHRAPGR